jgi:hypothetical protein
MKGSQDEIENTMALILGIDAYGYDFDNHIVERIDNVCQVYSYQTIKSHPIKLLDKG